MKNMGLILAVALVILSCTGFIASMVFLHKEINAEEEPEKEFETIGFTIENVDGSMGFSHMKIVLHKPLLLDLKKGGYVESCTIELSEKFKGDYCILVKMSKEGGRLPINGTTFPILPEGVQAWKIILED